MRHFETPKKDVALALALAAGASVVAAVEQAKVSRATAHRKLADPAFRQLVAELRSDFIGQAVGRLAHNMTRAADSLAALLDTADERVRLRVSRAVLTLGVKLHEEVDLEQRIRELEATHARWMEGQP